MTTIVTRAGKGSPLTHTEVDTNFTNLNTNKLETAAIPLGTLAAPSISFLSDANTGIYSPGADTVAFVTAGSNRVHITSAGLVGIGTSSPSNTAGFSQQLQLTGNLPCISIDNTGTGANKYSLGVNASAAFGIWDNTASAYRMYINSSGLVGIGTTSPTTVLNIVGTTTFNNTEISGGYNTLQIIPATAIGSSVNRIATVNTTGLSFETAGSERARIDTSGRLLVGTSTSVAGTIGFSGNWPAIGQFNSTSTNNISLGLFHWSTYAVDLGGAGGGLGNGPDIILARSNTNTQGSHVAVTNNILLGRVNFSGSDGTQFINGACIAAAVDGTPGANDMPGRLVFSTTADGAASPTERMRIDNLGQINTFSGNPSNTLNIANANAASTSVNLITGNHSATVTGTGTLVFIVRTNGNVLNTNNSYGAISDIKLKENIVNANSQWSDIKALQVRNYNFKEGQTHTQIGLVAQEVELVSPGLVAESPDRDKDGNDLGTVTKGVNYSVLYMKAVKALQEAMERIEALEADVAQLKVS